MTLPPARPGDRPLPAVAILGTGAMGSGLASNLAADGHPVTVWNRTPTAAEQLAGRHRAIAIATSARVAAGTADIVIATVTDDEASREVWLHGGALAGLRPGAVAIESSTISPAWAIELAGEMTRRRRRFLEAPVLGSRPQVAARELRYLIGGDAADLEAARPVLAANAASIHHLGPIGDAATMKLAINGLLAIQVAAFSEIVGMLDRSTVDRSVALDLIGDLPLTSAAIKRVLGLIGCSEIAPNFTIDLVAKDLRYLTAAATELDARAPLSHAAHDVFSQAEHDHLGRQDIAALARRYLAR
jgi:3-hydroxyisobutyrate dehydrogenase